MDAPGQDWYDGPVCGFFGSVFEMSAQEGLRARMGGVLAALQHRGPDDHASAQQDEALFGFARLSVLDLSLLGRQPMRGPGDTLLVYNGEIYNYRELRADLEARGHAFQSHGDTEVLLAGWREYGPAIVGRLSGMFAFALYDAGTLFVARDLAGKKPLFWTRTAGGGIRFASEAKALFASGITPRPRLETLGTLLRLGYTLAPDTAYEGIFELPPGHQLTLVRGGDVQIARHTAAPLLAQRVPQPEAAARADVERAFERAVQSRMVADVPVGTFLSGGLDSSLVTAIAVRNASTRLATFSMGFEGDAAYDETEHARAVAAHLGTDHHELRLGPHALAADFDELLARLTWVHDAPFADSSAIPTSLLAKFTKDHVTVALSGDGGDEIFCGYVRFLAAEASALVPAGPGRMLAGLAGRLGPGGRDKSLRARAVRLAKELGAGEAERLVGYSPLRATLDLVRPELRERVGWQEPVARFAGVLDEAAGHSALERILHHNFATYLPGDLLVKADRSSMLHGLEVRSPFLDRELIDVAARLPTHLLRRGPITKYVLRRAFPGALPPSIRRRKKMGFGVPLGTWFRGPLRPALETALGPGAKVHEWLEPAATARLLREHATHQSDWSSLLFLLWTMESWLAGI